MSLNQKCQQQETLCIKCNFVSPAQALTALSNKIRIDTHNHSTLVSLTLWVFAGNKIISTVIFAPSLRLKSSSNFCQLAIDGADLLQINKSPSGSGRGDPPASIITPLSLLFTAPKKVRQSLKINTALNLPIKPPLTASSEVFFNHSSGRGFFWLTTSLQMDPQKLLVPFCLICSCFTTPVRHCVFERLIFPVSSFYPFIVSQLLTAIF